MHFLPVDRKKTMSKKNVGILIPDLIFHSNIHKFWVIRIAPIQIKNAKIKPNVSEELSNSFNPVVNN